MAPEVVIIGCGFLGEAAAALFSARGFRVLGLVRSRESLGRLAGSAFEVALCDVTDENSVGALNECLRGVPLAIHAVSPGSGGEDSYASLYRDGLARVIRLWNPLRTIFISSTSVYGQDDGSWVTEECPADPPRETGRILRQAEEIALGAGGLAARFSGIYGPGRSYILRSFLAGEALIERDNRWMNQIHRDDGASALLCLADPVLSSGIYNVTDSTPATQREVYGWMADRFGRPLPPEAAPGQITVARRRGVTSKKISNAKLRSLGWEPRYPSYRDALPQLAEAR